ncbi:MAG: hypothetical protein L0Z55_09500 [Planctomycetes bacterium]|nr:hypothetical protein [Planctomycetota bacterium]
MMFRRRRSRILFLWLAVVGAASTAAVPQGDSARRGSAQILDEAGFDYSEPHDERINAAVRAVLRSDPGGMRLEVFVSAVGPYVEPVPGYEWRAGANIITARELESLVAKRRLHGEARRPAGGRTGGTDVRIGESARLPTRRLRLDGSIDYHALTPEPHLLGLRLESTFAGEGTHIAEWRVDGEVRLRITVEAKDGRSHIVSVEGPPPSDEPSIAAGSEHGTAITSAWYQSGREDSNAAPPLPAGFDIAEWERRDLEARWVLLSLRLDGEPREVLWDWFDLLASRKEFELLELAALYGPAWEWRSAAAERLQGAGAPQWMRVALWHYCGAVKRSSHDKSASRAMFLHRGTGAEVLAWLQAHPDTPVELIRAAKASTKVAAGVPSPDASKFLPPHAPAAVFAHLDAPSSLEELGERISVEPGKVYLHQVLRAIDGFAQITCTDESTHEKLALLIRHPHEKVRQRAFLAYCSLDPARIPHDALRKVVADENATASDREAALFAYSYGRSPQVVLDLFAISTQCGHPAWKAAISRLCERRDDFTLGKLEALRAAADLPAACADFLDLELPVLRASVEKWRKRRIDQSPPETYEMLHLLATAELAKSPLFEELKPWTFATIRRHFPSYAMRDRLNAILAGATPPKSLRADKPAAERMRAYVREIFE